jgi:hypothetical protein
MGARDVVPRKKGNVFIWHGTALTLLAGLSGGFAVAAQGAAECSAIPSHTQQRECLERTAARAAADVISAQESIWLRIHSSNEDAEYKDRSLKLLAAAENQFTRYRSSQCDFEAAEAAGGGRAEELRLQCEIRLDRAYVESLRAAP